MKTEDTVVVVGSGMMGSGIGAMAALAGRRTILTDLSADRAYKEIPLARQDIFHPSSRTVSLQHKRALSSKVPVWMGQFLQLIFAESGTGYDP